ncbi:hypothetical protein [Nocardioides plantarum]|uniref:Uncharacterized protein n=1 Tax=Nocardioides plantarum TaxID=29299 RepID=A0ABV5KBL4_9ACTN|nr:hypothetical protein [Nocardioides plantarum]
MALFGRRKRDADRPARPDRPADPDPALPILSRDDATALDRMTREAFAQRGVEVTSDGSGQLRAMDGQTYGLSNLAAQVAREPRSAWTGLVAAHVGGMLASQEVPEPQSLDEVRSQVYPRLRWEADLPERPSYAENPLPGIVELAAVDYPTHVAELLDDLAVERLGGWAAIRAQGIVNLRSLEPMHRQTITADPERHDADLHLLVSDDFFGPSRVLVLDEVMAGLGIEAGPHGVLLAVPNRHLLALHPLGGVGVVAAMRLLAEIGTGEYEGQPGALSPHVYFRPASGGPIEQVTRVEEDGTVVIAVDGALADAFAGLGLLDG